MRRSSDACDFGISIIIILVWGQVFAVLSTSMAAIARNDVDASAAIAHKLLLLSHMISQWLGKWQVE